MTSYTRPHRCKLKGRSRTLPIFGKGDDENRYFKCWNCGFVCDVRRDELGDSDSNAGDDHTDYHSLANPNPSVISAANNIALRMPLGNLFMALRTGPDGEPKEIVHGHTSDISRGCPNCGTTNWRGDY